ncbi:aminodeoxychorismate lyase [Parasalinivibrio latis]|uniref:aminodeoxychorismate lyase n=1 Tax=Parasalinivibrio latis TaxID=2952610 RepID=UPI0030DF4372
MENVIWADTDGQSLSVSDRGVNYGDGCFTTMLVENGQINLFKRHQDRMTDSLDVLAIPNVDVRGLFQHLHRSIAAVSGKQVLKLVITRGSGGRGYSPEGCECPTIIVSQSAWPVHYEDWQKNGIELGLCPFQLGWSVLAGIKHLNRLEQVMVKNAIKGMAEQDAIVTDLEGNVVETSASNIFWRKENTVYTPELSKAGVKGVMRAEVISILDRLGYEVKEVLCPVEVIYGADEVFITNALMERVPVNRLGQTVYTERFALDAVNSELHLC